MLVRRDDQSFEVLNRLLKSGGAADIAGGSINGFVMYNTDILNLWPGPYTFIISDGCRVPEYERLRQSIRQFGTPLLSSSVNRAGDLPPPISLG